MTQQEKYSSLSPIFESVSPTSLTGHHKKASSYYTQQYARFKVIQNIVDALPNRAVATHPRYFSDASDEQAEDKQKQLIELLESIDLIGRPLDTFTWRSFWRKALKIADLEGNSYILLGEQGVSDTEQPLGDKPITWMALKNTKEINANQFSGFYESYTTTGEHDNVEKVNRNWHPTRIIKLAGIPNMDSDLNDYRDHSVLKPIIEDFHKIEHVFEITTEMLEQHSLYIHSMSGLAEKAARKGQAFLEARFKDIFTGIKNLGGLFIDKNQEEAQILSRNYSGVDKLIDKNIDWFVANTGLPRFVVLGQSQQNSLSSGGDQEAKVLNGLVAEYQLNKLLPGLSRIANNLSRANNLSDLDITFLPTYPLDEKQEAEVRKINAESAIIEEQLIAMRSEPDKEVDDKETDDKEVNE